MQCVRMIREILFIRKTIIIFSSPEKSPFSLLVIRSLRMRDFSVEGAMTKSNRKKAGHAVPSYSCLDSTLKFTPVCLPQSTGAKYPSHWFLLAVQVLAELIGF
jgi:hypothetical protein